MGRASVGKRLQELGISQVKITVGHVSEVLRERSHISEEREGELWEGLEKMAARNPERQEPMILSGGPMSLLGVSLCVATQEELCAFLSL